MQYANTHSLPLLVKNSGHGFTKTLEESIRPEQNGIQLSLKGLDNFRVDTKKNTVTVGGGVKNWQVADAVFAAKKRTC